MQGRAHTNDEILEAVDVVRASYGACTYTALAEQLGMSRNGVVARVTRMVRDGALEQSELPGSIRRPREAGEERGVLVGERGPAPADDPVGNER